MEDPQNHMPKRIRSTSKVSIRFLRSRRPTEEDKECPGNAGRDELGRIRFVIHPSERDIDADDPRAVQLRFAGKESWAKNGPDAFA